MKKENIAGAMVERGKIVSVSNGVYTVESLDRDGITALPTTPIDLETFVVGDLVYFFVHEDGTGRIISGIEGKTNALTQADIVNDVVTDDATKVASAAVAKILNDTLKKMIVVKDYTGVLTNGALANLPCPSGVDFTDYYLPIIQAEYFTITTDRPASSVAHSYTVQANGNANFHLYVRDGTAVATGYINVRAFFVHK